VDDYNGVEAVLLPAAGDKQIMRTDCPHGAYCSVGQPQVIEGELAFSIKQCRYKLSLMKEMKSEYCVHVP
jgi:hypothetical protein